MNFRNKIILVTGASSGIGASAARYLALLGGQVALVGRNEQRSNEVVEQIKKAGCPTPLAIIADVTVDATRIINKTIMHFKKLDVLINSVGQVIPQPFENFEVEAFDSMMNTNVRSTCSDSSSGENEWKYCTCIRS